MTFFFFFDGIGGFVRRERARVSLPSAYVSRGKPCEDTGRGAAHKPRQGIAPESGCAGTLISDSSLRPGKAFLLFNP